MMILKLMSPAQNFFFEFQIYVFYSLWASPLGWITDKTSLIHYIHTWASDTSFYSLYWESFSSHLKATLQFQFFRKKTLELFLKHLFLPHPRIKSSENLLGLYLKNIQTPKIFYHFHCYCGCLLDSLLYPVPPIYSHQWAD